MTTINLKDFYYWYTQDQFIEVTEEVAERSGPASAMKRPTSGGSPGTRRSIPWTVRTGSNTPPAA